MCIRDRSTISNMTSKKENDLQVFKVPTNSEASAPGISFFNVQAFPNPFIQSTMIEFSNVSASEMVKVDVYNVQAQKVAMLFQGILPKNKKHRVRFDATNPVSYTHLDVYKRQVLEIV